MNPIRLKRAYEPPGEDEGARVLVDRLWPRGVSRAKARIELWLKDAAPSAELRAWFGHRPERWEEFARRYEAELKANEGALAPLRDLLAQGPVTLVYAAHDAERNNAVVLVRYLGRGGEAGGAGTQRRAAKDRR
ncbi:MAG: DUF488 family protein [Rhodospirillales bacterium]|nr:DUF488 family protein [Rhodospirillales bacterium]